MNIDEQIEKLEAELASLRQKKDTLNPLVGYKLSERDIGSLVNVWDADEYKVPKLLDGISPNKHAKSRFLATGSTWINAEPYLGPISLHFIPFFSTEETPIPPCGDCEFVFYLHANGIISNVVVPCLGSPIIGYRVVSFINPVRS